MAESVVVLKFGGSSVATAERLHRVAAMVVAARQCGDQVCVVISAMGEETDRLDRLARQMHPKPPGREMDMLLTAGERVSMALLSMALDAAGVASVSLTGSQSGILTDERHGNAQIHEVRCPRIHEALAGGKVCIVAGYQGVSPRSRDVTTLGRGGSDLTAVALAVALRARECVIYTDVAGVFPLDPHLYPGVEALPVLEARLAYPLCLGGAQVLVPRCLRLAARARVPLRVRSSLDPALAGTEIVYERRSSPMEKPSLVAMSCADNVAWLRFALGPEPKLRVAEVGAALAQHGAEPFFIDFMATDELELAVRLPTRVLPAGFDEASITWGHLVTLVGYGLDQWQHRTLETCSGFGLSPLFMRHQESQALVFFADPSAAASLVRALSPELQPCG